jgi:hypothetical protein
VNAALPYRWVLAKCAGCGLYAAYVARASGGSSLVVATIGVGLATAALGFAHVAPARDPRSIRAGAAFVTLILAALHARTLPAGSAFQALHLGLAAAVASSSVVTLPLHRSAGRPLPSLLLAVVTALLVAVARGPSPALWAACVLAAFVAWVRPLGALGAAFRALGLHHGPVDPGLFWDAVPAAPRAEEVRRCR